MHRVTGRTLRSVVPVAGLIDWNPAEAPSAAAVLLHPHPDMGGDRLNHVVDALYRGLPPAGVSAARFDFSSSDPVIAAREVSDALDAVRAQGGQGPLVVTGYSFGADIAATVDDGRVAGWVLVAPPLRAVAPAAMLIASDARPKLVLVPERDQFSPPARAREITTGWTSTTISVVPDADHFLAGSTAVVVEAALAWSKSLL